MIARPVLAFSIILAAFSFLAAAGPVLSQEGAARGVAGADDGAGSNKPKDPVARVAAPTKDDLQIRPGSLVLMTDEVSGQPYWIFTYTVVNTTGKTQRFTPRFDLVTAEGIIMAAGNNVPPEAQRRLQRAMGKLEAADQFQIMGDILEGEANAREGFVIWPASKGDHRELTMYIAGLSRAMDVRTDESTGQQVVTRRTMQRKYSLPGNPDPRRQVEVPLVSETWVMR